MVSPKLSKTSMATIINSEHKVHGSSPLIKPKYLMIFSEYSKSHHVFTEIFMIMKKLLMYRNEFSENFTPRGSS